MKASKNTDYIRTVQSKRIRECMAECGITGKEIAHELNYTPQHISYVLNGKRNLTVDMAVNLAQLFSKLRGYKMRNIEIPYSELSQEDKENLFNSGNIEPLENGNVMFYYDDLDSIDYRYLLGEVDQKTKWDNFEPPAESTADYLFKKGISAILHHYGYDIDINFCPDITVPHLIKNDIFHESQKKLYNDPRKASTITNVNTGDTLELLPSELFLLFQDFSKSVLTITERKFEKQKWLETLNG